MRRCGVRSSRARSKASRTIPSSRARPTSSSAPRAQRRRRASSGRLSSPTPRSAPSCPSPRPALLRVLDRCTRRSVRRLVDKNAVDRRCRLQARGGVDDVSRGHAFSCVGLCIELNERLARRDADSELEAVIGGKVADGECRAYGALGVVLVRDRRAEERHDGVADELLHRAAVPFELRADARVVRTKIASTSSGSRPPPAREADEVAEDDGHDFPLSAGLFIRLLRGRAAPPPRRT